MDNAEWKVNITVFPVLSEERSKHSIAVSAYWEERRKVVTIVNTESVRHAVRTIRDSDDVGDSKL